jgi:hypothetical protein
MTSGSVDILRLLDIFESLWKLCVNEVAQADSLRWSR